MRIVLIFSGLNLSGFKFPPGLILRFNLPVPADSGFIFSARRTRVNDRETGKHMIELNPKSATAAPRYAGLIRRLLSMLYESLVFGAVLFIAAFIFILLRNPQVPGAMPFFQVYLVLVALGFFTWFWTHGGQTVAMKAWRIRIERRDGKALGFAQASLRFVLAWLSILSVLWAVFDRDHQFLHDRLAGTRIVMV